MDDKNFDNDTRAPELTLVDIEELRRTLGAEADVAELPADAAAVPTTIMCPQWF